MLAGSGTNVEGDSRGVEKPTRIRYLVVTASFSMAVLLYLDRFCVAVAEPYIRQDLGLTKQQMGYFFSAFFYVYALGQVPAGWLSDRFGARGMLTLYISIWSLFTAMMGFAGGLTMLLITRAAYGLGQAGAYPTSSTIISRWIPIAGRGGASAIISGGGRIGGMLAPVLTTFLIVALLPADTPKTFGLESIVNLSELRSDLEIQDNKDEPQHLTYLSHQLERRLTGQSAAEFVAALNSLVEDPTFYSPDAFKALKKLDRQATVLVTKINSGEILTTNESQTLNRFLIEAVLDTQLKGIYVHSWRPVLWIYGALGVVVASFFWWVARNNPKEHPGVNSAELALIKGDNASSVTSAGKLPMKGILTNRSLWASSLMQVGVNFGWIFVGTWFATYLNEEYEVLIHEIGLMAMTPFAVAWFGSITGGFATDHLARRLGLTWGRRLPLILGIGLSATAFGLCPHLSSPWAVTAMIATMAFGVDFAVPAMWAFNQDIGGEYAGSILGWGNMWGNLGGAVSPILLVYISETYSWNTMFYFCAIVMAVAALVCLFIDAEEQISISDLVQAPEPSADKELLH